MSSKSTFETEAFVLRTVKYGDHDVIVTFLGRDTGKFSAIARAGKSSKRRFSGCLLPMRSVQTRVEFKGSSDLGRLVEASVTSDFQAIETSFEKITIASYATELVRECTREGEMNAEPYDLLNQFYGLLASSDDDLQILRILVFHMELAVLDLVGHAPSLNHCHRCLKAVESFDKLRCSRTGEGLVCSDCRREGEQFGVLSQGTLRVLHYAQSPTGAAPQELLDPDCLQQARRVVDASLNPTLDKTLKSRNLLEDLFR